MLKLINNPVYLVDGKNIIEETAGFSPEAALGVSKDEAAKNTIAGAILDAHNKSGDDRNLKLRFDAMASHDITYVGIVQTARASGLEEFPLPYVLTNCHNSLCAVGGTINEDDHVFGLSAAKKYGGIYVPAHQAVIHQYMREMHAFCGGMILASDSHTRYGALGALSIGEGGGELAKQLLNKTYDLPRPEVVGVYLTGKPQSGVGPQDVALTIVGATFKNGFVKNSVMEFLGDGIANLDVEYRNGIDVMTTETTCLSSIWATDEQVQAWLALHGRPAAYKKLSPGRVARYDRFITIDLSAIKPTIALPFHPSNTYTIEELNANLGDILRKVELDAQAQFDGAKIDFKLTDKITPRGLKVDQGVIAGCAGGTFGNLVDVADILNSKSIGADEFALSIYPSSQPVMMELVKNGAVSTFLASGSTVRTAFCGPCFGAGDVPANGGLSIRHSTRNFPNREGSKPSNGQIASVALMDARSIAATAINGGILTPATSLSVEYTRPAYHFDGSIYKTRVYNGWKSPDKNAELKFGPNIADWPKMSRLTQNLLLRVAAVINDPVTTTDELIPSGETSSYRSNPLGLAEFTLSRKVPEYVGRSKYIQRAETARLADNCVLEACPELKEVFEKLNILSKEKGFDYLETGIGSVIYAVKPGDGSAREQAASCQKVLGGWANIAKEYATKRYRSNLINWGMLPFVMDNEPAFGVDDFIFIPSVAKAVAEKQSELTAYVVGSGAPTEIVLKLAEMTDDERQIILAGCLINYYKD